VSALVPLPVALPLLAAAALTATGRVLGKRVDDLVGIAVAAATAVVSVLLVFRSSDHDLVHWFGGWHPRHGLALGVSFTVEPTGAAIAALAATLVTAALVFAWRYFDEVGTLFHVLVLAFLGAMCGFALSGDLFNMFVWFELMSVAAYALTGYRAERTGPLQGAINFAVTNTVGSFLVLFGIGFLYARTGALNLDQIGVSLAHHRPDGLVIAAFTLLVAGFLVKAGAVPFHFWLADAYAVAPIPVCVVFAGVMSDLGLHAVARIYWPVFSGTLGGSAADLRAVLVAVGLATALVGGTMCFLERDLKRMLAFLTVSNIGVLLVGIALLTPRGLAGSNLYIVADGLLRGALFLAVGMLVRRFGTGDELDLRGRGLRAPFAAVVFATAALGLALLPPFGPFLANSLVVDSARRIGYGWVPPLLALAVALAAGTIMRAGARIFAGLGDAEDPLLSPEPPEAAEEPQESARIGAPFVWIPALALTLAGLGVAFAPGIAGDAIQHAQRLHARAAHAREVLQGVRPRAEAAPSYSPSTAALAYGVATLVGAVAFAAFGLYRRRLPAAVRRAAGRAVEPAFAGLKTLHSGAVGDYVTWVVVGTAALGGAFALVLR
jgi:multicomponent Na+:H+ antiporter subunit D